MQFFFQLCDSLLAEHKNTSLEYLLELLYNA
mgnify:CR=1 FL=1